MQDQLTVSFYVLPSCAQYGSVVTINAFLLVERCSSIEGVGRVRGVPRHRTTSVSGLHTFSLSPARTPKLAQGQKRSRFYTEQRTINKNAFLLVERCGSTEGVGRVRGVPLCPAIVSHQTVDCAHLGVRPRGYLRI